MNGECAHLRWPGRKPHGGEGQCRQVHLTAWLLGKLLSDSAREGVSQWNSTVDRCYSRLLPCARRKKFATFRVRDPLKELQRPASHRGASGDSWATELKWVPATSKRAEPSCDRHPANHCRLLQPGAKTQLYGKQPVCICPRGLEPGTALGDSVAQGSTSLCATRACGPGTPWWCVPSSTGRGVPGPEGAGRSRELHGLCRLGAGKKERAEGAAGLGAGLSWSPESWYLLSRLLSWHP